MDDDAGAVFVGFCLTGRTGRGDLVDAVEDGTAGTLFVFVGGLGLAVTGVEEEAAVFGFVLVVNIEVGLSFGAGRFGCCD